MSLLIGPLGLNAPDLLGLKQTPDSLVPIPVVEPAQVNYDTNPADTGINASLSIAEADDTLSADVLVTGSGSGVIADLNVTEADDAISATVNVIAGLSLAVTEANDAITATAAVLVQPSASITEANDALGATVAVLVQASATITEADDALAASSAVLVQANASVTEADDSLNATASVASGAITANLNVTEANDTLSATAVVTGSTGKGPAWRRLKKNGPEAQDKRIDEERITLAFNEIYEKDIEEIVSLVAEDEREMGAKLDEIARLMAEVLEMAEQERRADDDEVLALYATTL